VSRPPDELTADERSFYVRWLTCCLLALRHAEARYESLTAWAAELGEGCGPPPREDLGTMGDHAAEMLFDQMTSELMPWR
jgi:hypothetical protein